MSDGPKRIQLQRTKGWRMPAGAVKVDRTTKWGNPFKVGEAITLGHKRNGHPIVWTPATAAEAVAMFRRDLEGHGVRLDFTPREIAQLRGKDLACWCKLGEPCHADVLLEVANRPLRVVPLCAWCGGLVPAGRTGACCTAECEQHLAAKRAAKRPPPPDPDPDPPAAA